jgi:hypothetical protein
VVFQDQLLDAPLSASAPPALRRRQTGLITATHRACRACPLIVDCLYRAVVEYDVAGYVASTTPPQRARIRQLLGITNVSKSSGRTKLSSAPTRLFTWMSNHLQTKRSPNN